jgi:hypothetical protein
MTTTRCKSGTVCVFNSGGLGEHTEPTMLASMVCVSKPRSSSVVVDWEATSADDARPKARVSLYIMKIIILLNLMCRRDKNEWKSE